MTIAIEIPPMLRNYCDQHDDIFVTATTVHAALLELKQTHPQVYLGVCDETGSVRRHIHLFVNSKFVSTRDSTAMQTELESGDVLTIWTAVSGG